MFVVRRSASLANIACRMLRPRSGNVSLRCERHLLDCQLSLPLDFHLFFFLNDPAPTEFYPLPLHDALPIYSLGGVFLAGGMTVAAPKPMRSLPFRVIA